MKVLALALTALALGCNNLLCSSMTLEGTSGAQGSEPAPADLADDRKVIEEASFGAESTTSKDRIVGGYEVKRGEFPWVIGIWTNSGRRPFCGGSLINNRFVLTAAHCIHNKDWQNMKIVLGDHDVTLKDEGEVSIAICGVKVYPKYTASAVIEDLAIIQLCQAVQFSSFIQPIALATKDTFVPDGTAVTVAGWGTVVEGGSPPEKQRAVSVFAVNHGQCKQSYSWLNSGQICAGMYEAGGKDSCQGDSGGSLWWTDPKDGGIYQIGVVSSGNGCARIQFPGVYTFVPFYYDWILNTMAQFALNQKAPQ